MHLPSRHALPPRLAAALMLAGGLGAVAACPSAAEPNRVTLPADPESLTHFATVRRGNVTEHMVTTDEAIAAVRDGEEIPDGTHVILIDYREGSVHRYFVMQKGDGWGADYGPGDTKTADWQFQWYWPDGSINMDENTERCRSCHESRADRNYMYTFRDLVRFAQTGEAPR